MIRAVQFQAIDLSLLQLQPAQLDDWPEGDERIARGSVFAQSEHCYTFVNAKTEIVACAGLLENHANCMTAWALLSEMAVADFLAVTRWLRDYLDNLPCRRFDMMVRGGFANAHQWARLLRFNHEGVQRAWFPDGDDMHVYARIREI